MSLGIECLTTDDEGRAWAIAQQLDAINRERRDIEAGMQDTALRILEQLLDDFDPQDRAPSAYSTRPGIRA
jgi:single-stranded-DNA-specific exonuclease